MASATEKSTEDVLYEDKFCKLTKRHLTIKCFYFPATKDREKEKQAIKKVYYLKQGWTNFMKVKIWGMALSRIWWACDVGRQLRGDNDTAKNVVIDMGEST